jgi:hypothetical protein
MWFTGTTSTGSICIDSWELDSHGNVVLPTVDALPSAGISRSIPGDRRSGGPELRPKSNSTRSTASGACTPDSDSSRLLQLVSDTEAAFRRVLRRNAELESEIHHLRSSGMSTTQIRTAPRVPPLDLSGIQTSRPPHMGQFDISTPRSVNSSRAGVIIRSANR